MFKIIQKHSEVPNLFQHVVGTKREGRQRSLCWLILGQWLAGWLAGWLVRLARLARLARLSMLILEACFPMVWNSERLDREKQLEPHHVVTILSQADVTVLLLFGFVVAPAR